MLKNIDRIHPIKRDKARKSLEYIERTDADGIIRRVIVFGSAVTEECTAESDIDFCLDTDVSLKDRRLARLYGGIPGAAGDLCDILFYGRLDGRMKAEIDGKGVTVYESREDTQ